MNVPRTRSWPDFSACNSTNHADVKTIKYSTEIEFKDNESRLGNSLTITNTNSELIGKRRDSTGSCQAWSMSSFMAKCLTSPSPVCSTFTPRSIISCSPTSDIFYSQVSTEFSTPRNKSSCTISNDGTEIEEEINNANDLCSFYQQPNSQSNYSKEIEEEINNANDLCSFYQQPNSQSNYSKDGHEDVKQECSHTSLSFSSRHKSVDACQTLLDMVVVEEQVEGESHMGSSNSTGTGYKDEDSSDTKSPINGHHKLMTRPKSYHAFLNEIKKKELEAQVNAWKEAKHLKLMNKLRSKEAAINAWELKKTRKVSIEMKKLERKLERKRAKAMEKMQMKIKITQRKAEEKKMREIHSTINKISMISRVTDKIRATRNLIWLKFSCLW